MWRARVDPERAHNARTLGLSGSLEYRLAHLERSVPDGPLWVPAGSGLPLAHGTVFRTLIAEARRYLSARRWVAALSAYENAERWVEVAKPTLRLNLERQRQERDGEALTAALDAAAAFRKGKKRGATDALGRVLAGILAAGGCRMHSEDVRSALRAKAKAGDPIVLAVPPDRNEVVWRDPADGARHRTAWGSVLNRLTTLRRARLLGQ